MFKKKEKKMSKKVKIKKNVSPSFSLQTIKQVPGGIARGEQRNEKKE